MPKHPAFPLALLALALLGAGHAAPLVEQPAAAATLQAPVLLGVEASCQGNAPSVASCSAGPVHVNCAWGCFPRVSGTIGYTGWAQATIQGYAADGSPATAWERCEFFAGQIVSAGVRLGTRCTAGGSIEMQGPFVVRGDAWPSSWPGSAAWRGPFTANLVSS